MTKHLTMNEEDYLEAILNISLEKGYAKSKDVSSELCITPSSVTEMFVKLSKKGLLHYRKYEGVSLTPEGKEIAQAVKGRHDVLVGFLKTLGVPDDVAEKDGCFMEHELSAVTIEKIKAFTKSQK
ncbi:MAG: metal-dependent transcriptional regulator [Methanocorpusculum sp.]|nr:metal-dependent transcriptional regulator [Methanocorpusculum sp.]